MNPCPCGYFQDPEKNCTCSASVVPRYQKWISGPPLDRIDIHVDVPRYQKWIYGTRVAFALSHGSPINNHQLNAKHRRYG
jgi:predicted ATPase with chaperone activity